MRTRLILALSALSLVVPAVGQTASLPSSAQASFETDPRFVAQLAEAARDIKSRDYGFAVEAYKKANKIARGACVRCLSQAYEWQMKLGEFKDASNLAAQLELLATSPLDRSVARTQHAHALLRAAGDKPKPAQLEAVHSLYQEALTDLPGNLRARYADACVLAQLGRMDEAGKSFAACAETAAPGDPMRIRARRFAKDPVLALNKMAPAFTVTALDGSRFTLDEMGGRVVLIDFWATWCGPCNQELPHMRKIARDFAGQPLTIISVSWDEDEAKWKAFLQKNEMTWVQYRDADHSLSKSFGVEAIPHYFTIDSDGVLSAEILGSGSDVEGKLKKLLARIKPNVLPAPASQTGGD